MRTVRDILSDLKDKKILLRVDFDVPVSDNGQIEETFRIKKQKETLDYLILHGAHVIMTAHISAVSSFAELIPQFHMLLSHEVNFIKSVPEVGVYLDNYAGPALLDNIRQNSGEENNNPEFSKQLAAGFDLYVNNDFAVCHRNHASVSAITKILPSYAGFLVEQEVAQLERVIQAPKDGKTIIIGGAKAETKALIIKNFLDKADKILIGGVIANDILKAKGQDVGGSVVDENASELLAGLDLNSPRLVMPKDYNYYRNKILDIGPEAIKEFSEIIKNSKMVIWNGPMGMFEDPRFADGTNKVAQAITGSSSVKIVGGGDTISAIDRIGLISKFDFVSTGGGAMLAFMSGKKLPGLRALGYYQND